MPQLTQSLSFDLTNPFPRNAKDLADFLQRTRPAVIKTKAQPQDVFLTISQRI